MELTTREDGNVVIITLAGDLVIGQSETSFNREVTGLLEDGKVDILLDCEGLGMVDSTGLGALVRTLTSCQKEGGQAKLLRPGVSLRKLLEMTKLDSVFETFDSLEEAVASF